MQSNDVRMLLHCAVPTALAGAVGVAVGAGVVGAKGAIGAAVGSVVVILFMGVGLAVLQGVAKSYPYLFQAMGLMLYTTQLLALGVVMAVFKNTTLFDTKTFAFTLLGAALVWIAAQARAHMKAKILYVQPGSTENGKPLPVGPNS